jgi:hypothetical protein
VAGLPNGDMGQAFQLISNFRANHDREGVRQSSWGSYLASIF